MSDWRNDIERYWRGELSPAEMHALEKRALADPFLAEALEGAENITPAEFSDDIAQLQNELERRTERKRERGFWIWPLRIAAGIAVLALATFLIVTFPTNRPDLAMKKTVPETAGTPSERTQPDSVAATSEKPEADQGTEEKSFGLRRRAKPPDEIAAAVEEEVLDVELEIPPVEFSPPSKREAAAPARPARVVEGFVVDAEDGRGLPGVNVTIKGTNVGTITNEEGKYQIPFDTPDKALVFSYIGFETKEIMPNVSGQKVDVALDPDISELSEVVVVGYGEARDPNAIDPTNIEIAAPAGGKKAFKQYLADNLRYPEQALNNKIEGKVTVQFTLESNGVMSDFRIVKGIGYGCEDEVIRLIKSGPKWRPTKRNNEPVRDRVKVRMRFSLPKDKK